MLNVPVISHTEIGMLAVTNATQSCPEGAEVGRQKAKK
jgi:hypothetical protein